MTINSSTLIHIKPVKLRSASEEYSWSDWPKACFEWMTVLEMPSASWRLAVFHHHALWAPVTWWQPIYLQHGRPTSSNLTLHHNFLRIYTFMNHKRKEASPLSIALVNSLVNLTNTKCKGTKKKERTLKRSFVHWSKINIAKVQETTDEKFFFSFSSLYSSGSNIRP